MTDEQEKYRERLLWEARRARNIISGGKIADELYEESSSLVSSTAIELESEDKSKGQQQYDEMQRLIKSQEETISSLRELLTTLQESLREAQDSNAYIVDSIAMSITESNARFAALETTLKNSERSKDKLISDLRLELQHLRSQLKNAADSSKRDKKNLYGSKSQKGVHAKKSSKTKDREEEKDDFDGTPGSLPSSNDSTPSSTVEEANLSPTELSGKVKKKAIRPSKYKTMQAARVIQHKCDLGMLPDDYKFIRFKTIKEFTHVSYIQEDRYEIAIVKNPDGQIEEFYNPLDKSDDNYPRRNVVKGTHVTPELLSEMIINKYQLHTPINRQMLMYQNDKGLFSQQTVANYYDKAFELCSKLQDSLKTTLLTSGSFLNCDETWVKVRVLINEGTKIVKKYMWVFVNAKEKVTYFLYDNGSRSRAVLQDLLEDFKGSTQSDCYVAYKYLDDESVDIEHIVCMAHVRSKFKDAQPSDSRATYFLEEISKLYKLEEEFKLLNLDDSEIVKRRKIQSLPVLHRMKSMAEKYLKQEKKRNVPTSGNLMYMALNYFLNSWNELIKYTRQGYYTIDNSAAERSIRPLTIGRKNYIHFGSDKSARISAFFYSLVETCKMRGVCVKEYLTFFFRCTIEGRTDYQAMLPGVL